MTLSRATLSAQSRRTFKLVGEVRLYRRDLAQIDLAGGAVDGDEVTLAEAGIAHIGLAAGDIDADALGTGDAGLAHAARHHGGMGGLAAAGGQDALGGEEAMDVLGLGLLADQDDLLPQVAAQSARRGRRRKRRHHRRHPARPAGPGPPPRRDGRGPGGGRASVPATRAGCAAGPVPG
jgi:hypothetical protein